MHYYITVGGVIFVSVDEKSLDDIFFGIHFDNPCHTFTFLDFYLGESVVNHFCLCRVKVFHFFNGQISGSFYETR